MLGHKWERAQGTIVNAETLSPGSGRGSADRPVHRYTVRAQKPSNGESVRGTIDERHEFRRALDSTIYVEVHSHNNELRIDPDDPGPTMAMINIEQQMRDTAAAAGPFGAGGFGGPGGSRPQVQIVDGSVHMIGPDGQEIAADVRGEDIRGLLQAMMSGDPAAKQEARDRMLEIKQRAQQRAAGQQPGTPGSAGAGVPPQAGPAGSFVSFDSFGSAGSFGSFGSGADHGTAEQRLTALKQLLDKGILTESEYETKRQQIIAEL